MLIRNGMRQPQVAKFGPVNAATSANKPFDSNNPTGTPNCGQLAMKPRLPVRAPHSMANRTEPPHSPPTPMPCSARRSVSSTPPRMPMLAYGGTRATRNVPIPISDRVMTSVALRPMRSP